MKKLALILLLTIGACRTMPVTAPALNDCICDSVTMPIDPCNIDAQTVWSWEISAGGDTVITLTASVDYHGDCMDEDGRGYATFIDSARLGHDSILWHRDANDRLYATETFPSSAWSSSDTVDVQWWAHGECAYGFDCGPYLLALVARDVLP